MDIATILGIVSGIAAVLGTIMMGSGLGTFVNVPSMMIVGGGTIAATLIAYPLREFLMVMGLAAKVFVFKIEPPEELVEELVKISNKARKGGILSIEKDIASIRDPFFAAAMQMVIDGVATKDIIQIMQKQIQVVKRKHKIGWGIFGTMGTYSPAFGMVGTLIGLIQMLASLDDPSTIGPKMAVAMITTFYGALAANLLFNPMSDKLKLRSEEEITNMKLLSEGVISIREGEHPRLMADKLKVYLGANAGNGKAEQE
ncbi:MAG: MotA/TolQ/ExbB proton channel family protein [Thermodesulfobacteriota bacterium]|nr:MotA/TolQ/ExbB proton channel family protein [Thermodesulfobacteriota bacterium]